MNYKIIFLKPASEELEESFYWYENKRLNLGLELIEEIEYYLNLIENNLNGYSFLLEELNLDKV